MDKLEQREMIKNSKWEHICSKAATISQSGFLKGDWQQLFHRWWDLLFDHTGRQLLAIGEIFRSFDTFDVGPRVTKVRKPLHFPGACTVDLRQPGDVPRCQKFQGMCEVYDETKEHQIALGKIRRSLEILGIKLRMTQVGCLRMTIARTGMFAGKRSRYCARSSSNRNFLSIGLPGTCPRDLRKPADVFRHQKVLNDKAYRNTGNSYQSDIYTSFFSKARPLCEKSIFKNYGSYQSFINPFRVN